MHVYQETCSLDAAYEDKNSFRSALQASHVLGEASESEEEAEEALESPSDPLDDSELMEGSHQASSPRGSDGDVELPMGETLRLKVSWQQPPNMPEAARPPTERFDSVLHQRLFADAKALRAAALESKTRTFAEASKTLIGARQQLSKAYSNVQNVRQSARAITNDLFHLEDKLDIVSGCTLLPDLAPVRSWWFLQNFQHLRDILIFEFENVIVSLKISTDFNTRYLVRQRFEIRIRK